MSMMNQELKTQNSKLKTVLFTGGHATPAFAVLDVLRQAQDDTQGQIIKTQISNTKETQNSKLKTLSTQAQSIKNQKSNTKKNDNSKLLPNGKRPQDVLQTYNFLWVGEKFNQKGTKNPSAEFRTVTEKYKIPFINIVAGKINRHWDFESIPGNMWNLVKLKVGFVQAFFIILKNKPDLIMSFGGFLAVPIVIWSKILGVQVFTHEQTIVTGLANRIISKFANKIFVSWESSLSHFPRSKTILTGNPIRKDIFEINSHIFNQLNASLPTIYITGGNQGAHEINYRVFEILPEVLRFANVIHQTGNSSVTNDFIQAQNIHKSILQPHIVKTTVGKQAQDDTQGQSIKNQISNTKENESSKLKTLSTQGQSIKNQISNTKENESSKLKTLSTQGQSIKNQISNTKETPNSKLLSTALGPQDDTSFHDQGSKIGDRGVYLVQDYFMADEIGEVMNKSDLIVSRAGANTITEILALGKLSILIPIPWTSHDEQTKNAKYVEELGLAIRLVQSKSLTANELLKAIEESIEHTKSKTSFNNKPLAAVITQARSKVKLDAAGRIAEEIEKVISSK